MILLPLAAGCAEIRWRSYVYEPGAAEAQRESKPMLVYLRNWYMPECTDFENNVLKTAPVISAADGFYAIMLEADWATELCKRWSLTRFPAVVTLDSRGEILGRRSGKMSAADVISLLDAARLRLAPASGPASAPAPTSAADAPPPGP